MNRPAFLDAPAMWTRAGSRSYDPIRSAYAIEAHKASNTASDYVMAALFVGFCLLMIWGIA